MFAIHSAIDRFRGHLLAAAGQGAAARFDRHLHSAPDGALAEAALFDVLFRRGLSPTLADHPSTGGIDFSCSFGGNTFAVEVTALANDTVATRCVKLQDTAGGFTLDTNEFLGLVRKRVSSKGTNKQARSSPLPRVLAIVSGHPLADPFIRVAASELITGQVGRAWRVGPNGAAGNSYSFTQFKNAAHLRFDPAQKSETFRPRDTLIMLAALSAEHVALLGILNPKPTNELPAGAFSFLPTVQVIAGVAEPSLTVGWSSEKHDPYIHGFFKSN